MNIEELTNTKYVLQILNNPLNENDMDEQNGLRLASKHGQDYFCVIPTPSVKTHEKEEDKIPKSTPVESLLEPLRTNECFKIVKGWWTYEFCYGRHILQYHMENDGVKGDVTYLGNYEGDFDWNKEALEETLHSKRHIVNRYHSQTYVNGSACDIINHNRDTEVRYFCDYSTLETYIERVDEPSTCSYIITIKTPYLCSHPRTRPIQTPQPESISCQPILSVKDFKEFQMVQSWRKQQAEIETQRRLETQKILLGKAMGGQTPINLQDLHRLDSMQGYVSIADFLLHGNNNNLNLDTARTMIEKFAGIEGLYKLNAFQQKRLLMDVSDLLKMHDELPTADRARIIQNYVTRFIHTPKETNQRNVAGSVDGKTLSSDKSPSAKKPVKIHLKFQKLDLEKLSELTENDFMTTDDDTIVDPAWKKLEDEVTKGLEDVGYQSDEHLYEIRVITSKDSITDTIKLDPEEAERFRQMLVELVAGNTAMTKEVEKQKSLANNYNMVWERDSAVFTVQDWDKDEKDDPVTKQL